MGCVAKEGQGESGGWREEREESVPLWESRCKLFPYFSPTLILGAVTDKVHEF